ncbi:MAG: 16S rRNA (guanine(527)-N(7))-methyltransferase RsmG [Gammaproteobacteria bacterium]
MTAADCAQRLIAGSVALGLTLPASGVTALCDYIDLLAQWNRRYNLTAVRDPGEMVTRHLLDSLAVAPYVQGTRVLDAGTGAGLPGIPLAVAFPDKHFTLLDSAGKKTRFVMHAALSLGLGNVEVVQARTEDYRPTESFATVLSRAFAHLADFLARTRHLGAPGGRWLAMKGAPSTQELQDLPAGFRLVAVHPLRVPELDAKRCVVEVVKA